MSEYDLRTHRFTYISEQAERILGYPPELLESDPGLARARRRRRSKADRGCHAQALQERSDYAYEHRIRAADGRLVWLRVSASLVLDEHGRARSASGRLARHHRAEGGRSRARALALAAPGDARRDRRRDPRRRPRGSTSPRTTARSSELWPIPRAVLDAGDDGRHSPASLGSLADPDEFVRRVTEIYEDPASAHARRLRAGRRQDDRARLGAAAARRRDRRPRLVLPRHHREAAAQRALQRVRAALPRDARERRPRSRPGIDAHGIVTFANDVAARADRLEPRGGRRPRLVRALRRQPVRPRRLLRADGAGRDQAALRGHDPDALRRAPRRSRWSSTLQHDESGAVAGIATIGEDVTERQPGRRLLRSREELFRSLIENASDVITILSADGTSLYESPSVERVLGWTPEELVGMPSFALLHPDDLERVEADVRRDPRGRGARPDRVQAAPPRRLLAHGRGDRSPAPAGRRVGRRRQLPRRHRPAPAAGAAAALAEARGGRTARRRDRARLQQPADRDRRLQPVPGRRLRRRRPAPRGRARDRARVRSRRCAHEPAARLQPPSGAAGGGARPGRGRRRAREPALAAPRRRRRALDVRRARAAASAPTAASSSR